MTSTRNALQKIALIALCIAALAACSGPTDDTDASPDVRSSMTLLIDLDTSCQYVYREQITLRMDTDGRSFCGKKINDLNGTRTVTVLTDFGTGCQYVSYGYNRGLHPRLGSDNAHLCNPNLKRTTKPLANPSK